MKRGVRLTLVSLLRIMARDLVCSVIAKYYTVLYATIRLVIDGEIITRSKYVRFSHLHPAPSERLETKCPLDENAGKETKGGTKVREGVRLVIMRADISRLRGHG